MIAAMWIFPEAGGKKRVSKDIAFWLNGLPKFSVIELLFANLRSWSQT
jgi:hypothetical protein